MQWRRRGAKLPDRRGQRSGPAIPSRVAGVARTRGQPASANAHEHEHARRGLALFLLAHQDDEFMLSPIIADAAKNGQAVLILFLTNGDGGSAPTAKRNEESRRMLASLNVDVAAHVVFLGDRLGVSDGRLHLNLARMHAAILDHLPAMPALDAIYVHAWEGGNPDHDAAYALALGVAKVLGTMDRVYQVPFYRAPRRGRIPYLMFAPLEANGPVAYYRVGLLARLARLLLIRFFPSQRSAFLRMGPGIVLDVLLRPGVPLQPARAERLSERPMTEPLRYERIRYVEFSAMLPHIKDYWRAIETSSSIEFGNNAPERA